MNTSCISYGTETYPFTSWQGKIRPLWANLDDVCLISFSKTSQIKKLTKRIEIAPKKYSEEPEARKTLGKAWKDSTSNPG